MAILDSPFLLQEKYGTNEEVYSLAKEISYSLKGMLQSRKPFSIVLGNLIPNTRFLGDSARITVQILGKTALGGGVDSDVLKLDSKSNALENVVIQVSMGREDEDPVQAFQEILEHEIQHCYTIYRRLQKGLDKGDRFANIYTQNQDTGTGLRASLIRSLRDFFYDTSLIERQAYLSELSLEVERLYKRNSKLGKLSLTSIANSTPYGKHLNQARDLLADFRMSDGEDFETLFCDILNTRFRPNLKKLSYSNAIKWLENLYEKANRKFLITLGKVVHEIVQNKGSFYEQKKPGRILNLILH